MANNPFAYFLKMQRRTLEAQAEATRALAKAIDAQANIAGRANVADAQAEWDRVSEAAMEAGRAGLRLWQSYADFWVPPR